MTELLLQSEERIVLVALDGSPAAATALPIGRTIAEQLGGRVEGLHVASGAARASAGATRARLDRQCRGDVPLRVVCGDPVQEILRAVEEPSVALLVLATHGHTVAAGQLMARIPRRVVAETGRPVLLVRPEATDPAGVGRPFHRLLLPVDGVPSTTSALAPATELAGQLRADLDILFVVHPGQTLPSERGAMAPPYYVDQPYEWLAWQRRVAQWIRHCCGNLPPEMVVHTYIASGRTQADIGHVIAAFADRQGEEGIVLVRRSRLEDDRAPILRAVFERTPCPVLLVAGPTREAPPARAEAPEGFPVPAGTIR